MFHYESILRHTLTRWPVERRSGTNDNRLCRCSPTDASAPGLNGDGRADLGRVTKLLLLLLVRFATFLSAILSGMWAEWLPFSLNCYVKHACACVCVWRAIKSVPESSVFLFFFSLRLSLWVGGRPAWASSVKLTTFPLSSSPTEFPRQDDICALREKEGVSLKLFSLRLGRCWDASLAADSPVLWSASTWCSAAPFASRNKTLRAA